MSNKKGLFILWYILWVIVAMFFTKKTWKDLKNELNLLKDFWSDDFDKILNNFIDLHKEIYNTIHNNLLNNSNIEFIELKKEEAQKLLNEYKEKWFEILKEYKDKWSDFLNEWIQELDNFYKSKLNLIEENLKDKTSDDILQEIKKEFKNIVDDFKNYLKTKE